mgnify:CR=1 FL=1
MHQDKGGGGGHDRQPEDFTGMHEQRIEGAYGNQLMTLDPAARVEQQDNEAFTIGIEVGILGHVGSPVAGGLLRRVAELEVSGERAVTQGDDPPFLGLARAIEGVLSDDGLGRRREAGGDMEEF